MSCEFFLEVFFGGVSFEVFFFYVFLTFSTQRISPFAISSREKGKEKGEERARRKKEEKRKEEINFDDDGKKKPEFEAKKKKILFPKTHVVDMSA